MRINVLERENREQRETAIADGCDYGRNFDGITQL
jgi:hypothetical protein